MKKILLFLLPTFLFTLSAQAQCVPDTTISGIVAPPAGSTFDTVNGDPIVILPYAEVGTAYSEVLHFRVPRDTSYMGQSAVIDSIRLVQVGNLPTNFSMDCSPSDCVFLGGNYGCATMSGTPTMADSIQLTVTVDGTFTYGGTFSGPITETFDNYYLVIKEPVASAREAAKTNFAPKVFPNPASDKIFVDPDLASGMGFELQITNIIGRTVYSKKKTADSGRPLELDISSLKPGVYLYTVRSEEKTFTGRFSISR